MRRIFLIFICILLLTLPVTAVGSGTVDSLLAEVTVAENGTCQVTLTAQVSFTGAPTSFTMPLGADASDVTASGGQYKLRRVDGVRCAVFTNESGFVGTQTFICSFALPCAVVDADDSQTFTISLPEGGFAYGIQSFELKAQFPATVEQQPKLESAYHGDVIDNFLNIRAEGQNLTLRSVTPLKDQETISMELEFPADSFALRYLPGRITSFNQLAFYILLLAAIVYWAIRLRGKLLLPKKQAVIDVEATAGETDCRLYGKNPDIAGILAHWGNLGYVAIYRNERGRLILRKEMDMGNERKASEQKLFKALFRLGGTCDLQSLRFHTVCKPASASIRGGWVRRLFEKKAGSPFVLRAICLLAAFFVCLMTFDLWLPSSGWRWVFLPLLSVLCTGLCAGVQYCFGYLLHRRRLLFLSLGGAAALLLWFFGSKAGCGGLMFLNLLLQFLCALSLLFGGRRSLEGQVQVSQLLGLRRQLRKMNKEELSRLMSIDPQYFYRTLPFAEALGVGRAFCKRFDNRRIEPCPWLSDARHRPETVKEFYAFYKEILSTVRGEELHQLLGKKAASKTPARR